MIALKLTPNIACTPSLNLYYLPSKNPCCHDAMDTPNFLVSDLKLVSYVKAAFLTALAYDTLLHFGQEYHYVWQSHWSFIKCLYLWTRYSTFIDTIVALQETLDMHRDSSSCSHIVDFTTVFAGVGIGVTEMILMVRTYALYGRSKKLLRFFLMMWLSVAGVNVWAVIKYTASFKTQAPPSATSSCYLSSTSNIGLVCYVSFLTMETIIVLLTVWKGFHTFSVTNSTFQHTHFVTSFYRDGILFYLAILVFFITDVVIQAVAPSGLRFVADTPLRVMHSILSCHLVTHDRAVAHKERVDMSVTGPKSSVFFADFPDASQRSAGINA
ncbi:hypothetical protein B0H10DRAFT_2041310 [Mycena sp. CBHHK59/15]|nr:hypothetical protein B0H10DRAFT_2041310 [Mycena sp. CBHHK59/15]